LQWPKNGGEWQALAAPPHDGEKVKLGVESVESSIICLGFYRWCIFRKAQKSLLKTEQAGSI